MLPNNVILARDYERQNRNRIQREAENARLVRSIEKKEAPNRSFPVWKLTIRKVRSLRIRFNPTG
jgi:hypothetical protein